jgi:hypothetical protein
MYTNIIAYQWNKIKYSKKCFNKTRN